MEYNKVNDGGSCKIIMKGKFTFADHVEFKKICTTFNEGSFDSIEVNLEALEFVDSAALGLILLLKDEAEKHKTSLTLIRPQGQVQKMFKISRFYEMFDIVE